MEGITSNRERVEWLTEQYDLTANAAKALILSEIGFSHSKIARVLGVTDSTAQKYLDKLESEIGQGVTQAVPKAVRYPTFPRDTPKCEVRYSGDVVDVSDEMDEQDTSINRGCDLEEIDPSLISLSGDAE